MKAVKEVLPTKDGKKDVLVLYKNTGKFYNAIGIDAHILNFYFDYKVMDNKKAGFPESAFEKVVQQLEKEKISYQIIYTDKNPYFKNFKKLNRYEKIVQKVNENLALNQRIDLILEKIKSADRDQMLEIIERLEECFK